MPSESSKNSGNPPRNKPATATSRAGNVPANGDIESTAVPTVQEPEETAETAAILSRSQEMAPDANSPSHKAHSKKKSRSKHATKSGAVRAKSDDQGDEELDVEQSQAPRKIALSKKKRLKPAAKAGAVYVSGTNGTDNDGMDLEEWKSRTTMTKRSSKKKHSKHDTNANRKLGLVSVRSNGIGDDELDVEDSRPPSTRMSVGRKDPRSRPGNSQRHRGNVGATASVSGGRRTGVGVQQMEREIDHDGNRSEELDQSTNDSDEVNHKRVELEKSDETESQLVESGSPEADPLVVDHGMAGVPPLEYGTHSGGFGPGYGGMAGDHLAVAIAVEEEEETELFLHLVVPAVEYDPDAKPPLHKNRRFRLYTIAVSLLLFVVAVGAVVGIMASKGGGPITYAPTWAPSAAPSTLDDGEYANQFVRAVGGDVEVVGTPAYLAADWIMTKDTVNLPPDASNLIQRFILADFYFTTSQANGGWRSCGAPTESEGDDCMFQHIQRLDNDTLIYDPKPEIRWLSSAHECEWVGIECDEEREVSAIEVWGQNLTGTIPTFLTKLHWLQSISLSFNDFTGQIPSEFASMRHLVNLELHYNHLTGPIPEEYWSAQNLLALNVGDNHLNGTLSPNVGRLKLLKGLHIFENQFTGPFPVNVTTLRYLAYLRLDNNKFTGTFHTEFGQLTLLKELWYQNNSFHGTIPSEVGNMKSLGDLNIYGNNLHGTIPDEVYTLTNLFRLNVYNMYGIDGTLSTAIGDLANLEQLRLQQTSITGTVPTELGLCKGLRLVRLHSSEFSGSMPSSVCNLASLESAQAECGGPSPPFGCDYNCCTLCCEMDICEATNGQE